MMSGGDFLGLYFEIEKEDILASFLIKEVFKIYCTDEVHRHFFNCYRPFRNLLAEQLLFICVKTKSILSGRKNLQQLFFAGNNSRSGRRSIKLFCFLRITERADLERADVQEQSHIYVKGLTRRSRARRCLSLSTLFLAEMTF